MKKCPTCEEPIPDDCETCEDEICKKLFCGLIDPEYIRAILRDLIEAQLDFNSVV